VIEALRDIWDSPHWRWWTLLAGILLVLISAGVAVVVATVIGHNPRALTLLFLMVEAFTISLVGSGMLDGLSRRMSRGGLARETSDIDEMRERMTGKRKLSDEEVALRDRRAIRSGLLVLPVIIGFIILLFA
jgi:hypothetical protein